MQDGVRVHLTDACQSVFHSILADSSANLIICQHSPKVQDTEISPALGTMSACALKSSTLSWHPPRAIAHKCHPSLRADNFSPFLVAQRKQNETPCQRPKALPGFQCHAGTARCHPSNKGQSLQGQRLSTTFKP